MGRRCSYSFFRGDLSILIIKGMVEDHSLLPELIDLSGIDIAELNVPLKDL